MSEPTEVQRTLGEKAARQLANATKTPAQWGGITPRWLVSFLLTDDALAVLEDVYVGNYDDR